jgi:hypothetical protein
VSGSLKDPLFFYFRKVLCHRLCRFRSSSDTEDLTRPLLQGKCDGTKPDT